MIGELKRARQLLAQHGWVGPELEPFCVDALGRRCWESDEGVFRFSVQGALIESRAWPEGWYLLEAIVAPAHARVDRFHVDPEKATIEDFREFQRLCRAAVEEPTIEQWLATAGRRDEDVLRALVLAIQRGKKSGERRG